MPKVQQHTVPRFYLRLFTPSTGDKVLWEYSKKRLRPRRVSPRNATTRKHIYSNQLANGGWDETLEDSFERSELAAADPLKRLTSGRCPTEAARRTISIFVALLWHRPYGLRAHADAQASTLGTPDGTIAYIQSRPDIREHFSAEAIQDYIDKVRREGQGVRMPANFHLANLANRASRLAETIFAMNWMVEHCARDSFFITSDNPVFVRRPRNILDPGLVGFERDDLEAEMGFPLSRNAFLIARWNGARFDNRHSPKQRVTHLNERTVLSANECVFAPELSQEVAGLVTHHVDFQLRYPYIDLTSSPPCETPFV